MAKTAGGALNMHVIPSQSQSRSNCPSRGSKCVRCGGGNVTNVAPAFETNTNGRRRMRKRDLVMGFLPVRWMRSIPFPQLQILTTYHPRWYFNSFASLTDSQGRVWTDRQTALLSVENEDEVSRCWLFCNDFITQPETSNVTDCTAFKSKVSVLLPIDTLWLAGWPQSQSLFIQYEMLEIPLKFTVYLKVISAYSAASSLGFSSVLINSKKYLLYNANNVSHHHSFHKFSGFVHMCARATFLPVRCVYAA